MHDKHVIKVLIMSNTVHVSQLELGSDTDFKRLDDTYIGFTRTIQNKIMTSFSIIMNDLVRSCGI